MKSGLHALTILLLMALLLGVVHPVIAQENEGDEMTPAEVVKAVYAAVEAQDLETAGDYLADDAVLVLSPPPSGTNGAFVGKEAVLDWYQNLIDTGFASETSDVTEMGDRFTMRLSVWVDSLPVAPVEFDGAGVVQDDKVKAMSWVFTPETVAALDAAAAEMAREEVVRRILQEIWSEGNLDLADELVAEDYVSHSWPAGEGRDVFKEDVAGFRSEFPGATIVVDRIVFDENRAIIFSHLVGAGESLDPLPRDADIEDVLIYQIEDGQLTDRWLFGPFEP